MYSPILSELIVQVSQGLWVGSGGHVAFSVPSHQQLLQLAPHDRKEANVGCLSSWVHMW